MQISARQFLPLVGADPSRTTGGESKSQEGDLTRDRAGKLDAARPVAMWLSTPLVPLAVALQAHPESPEGLMLLAVAAGVGIGAADGVANNWRSYLEGKIGAGRAACSVVSKALLFGLGAGAVSLVTYLLTHDWLHIP